MIFGDVLFPVPDWQACSACSFKSYSGAALSSSEIAMPRFGQGSSVLGLAA
jgi:hypothetical protein